MKTVCGRHLDEDHIQFLFPLKFKTGPWRSCCGQDVYFESKGDQNTPSSTTRRNMVGRISSDQHEDRTQSSFGIKSVYGLHF